MSHTAAGKVATVTDPNGNITTNAYDMLNRLSTKGAPSEATVIYAYDQTSDKRAPVWTPGLCP